MMALADSAPAGIVMIGVLTTTAAGLSLTMVITTGPVFDGSRVIEIGKSVVCPSGTFSVIGAAIVLFDTTTPSDASSKPVAVARTVVVPRLTPWRVTNPMKAPSPMVAVAGGPTVSRLG